MKNNDLEILYRKSYSWLQIYLLANLYCRNIHNMSKSTKLLEESKEKAQNFRMNSW